MSEFYPNVMAETMIAQLTAELDRWRRHGIPITEDCGECRGSGEVPMREDAQGDFREPCPVCDGSGKVLKDGLLNSIATRFARIDRSWSRTATDCRESEPCYSCRTHAKAALGVFASWLEGASDDV